MAERFYALRIFEFSSKSVPSNDPYLTQMVFDGRYDAVLFSFNVLH